MCGIAGYLGSRKISQETINITLELMKNRGPDFSNSLSFRINENCGLNFLHSRLSIIDIHKRSNQPFVKDNYILIFNGEIYNFIELRKNLINKGIIFTTNSDTEVLLNYYIQFGEKCVNFFDGMWSFAIFNQKNKKLFLSRDRFGEKPLYYHKSKEGLYFGSEVKFIKSLAQKQFKINKSKIYSYLHNGYKCLFKDNQSFYEDIFTLNSSENLICDKDLNTSKRNYWNPKIKQNSKINTSQAIEHINMLLRNIIKLRMRSDVETAFLLSGGIDSGGIVSLASSISTEPIKTYSIIDQDEKYNEILNINKVIKSNNIKSKIISLSKNNFLEKLKKLINYHDSPVFTLAQYLHADLMSEIKKDGIKVVVSGVGADEFFSGYYDHYLLHLSLFKKDKKNFKKNYFYWKKYIFPHIRNPIFKKANLFIENPNFRDYIYDNSNKLSKYFIKQEKFSFKEENYSKNIFKKRRLNEIFFETIPVMLNNEDLNSMMNSIENRSPFLNKELFDFCFSLPQEILIQKGFSKYLLRESLKDDLIDTVRLDRQKKGFNCSISSLINVKNQETIDFLLEKESMIFEFIDRKKFSKIFDENLNLNYLNKFIFSFISAKMFLDKNN